MIKKTYTKTGSSCRVTFTVPPGMNAQTAYLCGDFNQWDRTSHPMKHRKDGSFSLTLSLKPGQQYCFRYLLDGERWENDATADAQTSNPFGSTDSVVQV
jgi:1,4-alpha-glucan branching enzyme